MAGETGKTGSGFGSRSPLDPLTQAATQMHVFMSEVMLMFMESVRQTYDAVDQMRSARSFEEVVKIQTNYLRETLEQVGHRGERLASLAAMLPVEFAEKTGASVEQAKHAVAMTPDDAKAATVGLDVGVPPPAA